MNTNPDHAFIDNSYKREQENDHTLNEILPPDWCVEPPSRIAAHI